MNPIAESPLKIALSDIAQNLHQAWQQTRTKGKAKGSDGQGMEDFEADLETNLAKLESDLQNGSYRPRPAQRVWQIKDGGGERGITVFCVRDRVAFSALRQALTRALAHTASHASFAYREGFGAVRAAHRLLEHRKAGRVWVVRSDIKDFFDTIPHHKLLAKLEPYLAPEVQNLLGMILQTPIKDGLALHIPERGIAQGSSISPLLSNFYLNPFDNAVNSQGRALVRYADDFVIAASTVSEAAKGLEVAQEVLRDLELCLNDTKTQVVSFEQGFDFLGFRFDASTVRVSPKSLQEFKTHLEALLFTRLEQFDPSGVKRANDLIVGWQNYYNLGDVKKDYADLEQWMRDRFGAKSRLLEKLMPTGRSIAKAPSLGGYSRPRPSQPTSTQAPAREPKATNHYPNVVVDSNQTPQTVRRGGVILAVQNLPELSASPALSQVLQELAQTALFHRANTACRWKTPNAADAASALTRAMMGQADRQAALAHYEVALLSHSADDARAARGTLRALLDRTAWAALLEAGLDVGASKGIPPLASAFADAFECLIADIALLAAMKTQTLEKPLPHFFRALGYQPVYRRPKQTSSQNTPWYLVLKLEAEAMKQALETQIPYRAFKFGLEP
jgi:RNA-directed DNA polymerase